MSRYRRRLWTEFPEPRNLPLKKLRDRVAAMRAERAKLLVSMGDELPRLKRDWEDQQARLRSDRDSLPRREREVVNDPTSYEVGWLGRRLRRPAKQKLEALRNSAWSASRLLEAGGYTFRIADKYWGSDYETAKTALTNRIETLRLELDRYVPVLITREERRQKKDNKIQRLEAMAAANTEATRNIAARSRHKFARNEACPYCGNGVGNQPHLDHIYPVSKGGRSNPENVVWVCSPCNLKKRDLTLGRFCTIFGLDALIIQNRLAVLEKDF